MTALAKRLTKAPGPDKLSVRIVWRSRRSVSAEITPMTITVRVGEAKTHLSDLLARVEAGEEIIVARGNEPVARLTRIETSSRSLPRRAPRGLEQSP